MDFTDMMFLYGIKRMNGERTTSGLYHLLTGKKSSQTVQDGKLFGLSHLFGTFQGYRYATFQEKILEYEKKDWIILIDSQYAQLTRQGEHMLENQLNHAPIPSSLNGWRYGDVATVFWRRFTLFVQTLSYVLVNDRKFHPIQNDPQVLKWVRNAFPRSMDVQRQVADQLHEELSTLLKSLDQKTAANIVFRLTRFKRVGKTSSQIADILGLDLMECHIHFQAAIHQLIGQVIEEKDRFSYLYPFISDVHSRYTLTDSTRKTYELIKAGYPHEVLPSIRKLKMSTIEDHIVELAIHVEDFDISPYIPVQGQDRIMDISVHKQSKKLKEIKQALNDEYNYFQIRLTLAKRSVETNMDKGVKSIVD